MVTKVVLTGGRMLGYLAVVLPLVLAVVAFLMLREWRRSAEFRQKADRFLFNMPLWGKGYESLSCLRFSRTLAFLLDGGIALPEAVTMAGRATGSEWVEALATREAEAIKHGSGLAEAVQRIPPLANGLPGWIQAGEASGDVAGLLKHAADRFDQIWERLIARAVQVFEAVIILFVGVCVLMLALAILLPILSLNQTML
jgi:type II secretory pathway component PulF